MFGLKLPAEPNACAFMEWRLGDHRTYFLKVILPPKGRRRTTELSDGYDGIVPGQMQTDAAQFAIAIGRTFLNLARPGTSGSLREA